MTPGVQGMRGPSHRSGWLEPEAPPTQPGALNSATIQNLSSQPFQVHIRSSQKYVSLGLSALPQRSQEKPLTQRLTHSKAE